MRNSKAPQLVTQQAFVSPRPGERMQPLLMSDDALDAAPRRFKETQQVSAGRQTPANQKSH